MNDTQADRLAIAEVVQNWAIWRDAGDWERFRTVWHDDGWMSATWLQGPAATFIEASRAGFEPLTQGLVAALPHVDEFLPCANIASLERLAVVLAGGE